jgi:hypothetical protein
MRNCRQSFTGMNRKVLSGGYIAMGWTTTALPLRRAFSPVFALRISGMLAASPGQVLPTAAMKARTPACDHLPDDAPRLERAGLWRADGAEVLRGRFLGFTVMP